MKRFTTALGCGLLLLFGMYLAPTVAAQHTASPTLAERLGYDATDKLLIVHADDIGVSHSVNRASIDALASGLISSGSVMVPCPWFPEIAAWARDHPDADLGLHLTLTSEWKHYRWGGVLPRSETPSLHDEQGFMHATTAAVATMADPAEAEREVRAQIERAKAFGMEPTHLDSHMGSLFATPALVQVYLKVGRDYGLPLLLPRSAIAAQSPEMMALLSPDDILIDHLVMAQPQVGVDEFDAFYTQVVENLQPGVTEIIIHVAYDDDEMRAVTVDHPDYGSAWRQKDLDFFTGPAFEALLEAHDITLITWRQIKALIE